MTQQQTIKCPDSTQTVVENEPRVSIEITRTIMVGGSVAMPGCRVTNMPQHLAFGLMQRGRAKLAHAGDA